MIGFNERTDNTFTSDIKAVHASFSTSVPGFATNSENYNIFYDFFIHVLKILDEKFRNIRYYAGKPTFNIMFEKSMILKIRMYEMMMIYLKYR